MGCYGIHLTQHPDPQLGLNNQHLQPRQSPDHCSIESITYTISLRARC